MPPSKTLPQVFIITPRQKGITHSSQTAFSEDLFLSQLKGRGRERGGVGIEDYGVEKITNNKPTRVLGISFDKFHSLCNLYIFVFCFVVT